MAKVLILYYSMYGHIETMAHAIADGAREVAGASVSVKRVPELMDEAGARQAGAIAQFGQPAWRLGDRVQHTHRFVEHADTAILSHIEILASRNVR